MGYFDAFSLPLTQARTLVKTFNTTPDDRRQLIIGLGIVGDPASLPWLIKQMHNPDLARLAGESFTMITGLDYVKQGLRLKADTDENHRQLMQAALEDNNDQDADLYWPDPQKVEYWYQQNKARFVSGQRYLAGQPLSVAQCKAVFKNGTQRQRQAAAYEIRYQHDNRPVTSGVLEIAKRACTTV